MARLLIASRSMALALRVADVHEVTEHPPERLDELDPDPEFEAVVLDVGESSVAVDAVRRLRDAGCQTPVLLVSGYEPEWNTVADLELPGVHVVPLPITRAALLAGIGKLTGHSVEGTPISPRFSIQDRLGDDDGDWGRPPHAPPSTTHPAETLPPTPVGGIRRPGRMGRMARRDSAPAPARNSFDDDPAAAGPVAATAGPAATTAGPGAAATGHESSAAGPGAAPTGQEAPSGARGAGTSGSAADTAGPSGADSPDEVSGAHPGAEDTVEASPSRRRPLLGGRLGRTLHRPPGDSPEQAPQVAAAPPMITTSRPPRPESTPQPAEQPAEQLSKQPSKQPAEQRSKQPSKRPSKRPPQPVPRAQEQARAGPAHDVEALAPEEDPRASLVSALERRLDAVAAPPPGSMPRTSDLVAMLLDRSTQLYGVVDTAQVLADDVVERADADAAAVLVPDGSVWRVSGGVGLRPLERRLVLEASHWLVAEVAAPGRAVLIEDTDIVRQQLAGAPLAAWRHVLAVPVPAIRAAVVLARGQEAGPFTDEDLAAVVPTVREASILLAQAMEVRRLARLLSPLRETEGEAHRRQDMP